MLRPFALYQPATLAEATDILAREGSQAVLYAGGTELLLLLKAGLLRVGSLVDLKRIPGLADITGADGEVTIGATATHRALERSAVVQRRCPIIAEVARHVANIRVRTVGTVGGNIAFADPHSDLATLFLTFDATVRLVGPRDERLVDLGDFVRGAYETSRAEDEVLGAVRLRPWPPASAGAYVKYGVHERPTLGVAVALTLGDGGQTATEVRVAVGCVAPRPRRLRGVEERARGRSLTDLVRHADELAALADSEVDPTSDLHGSAEYKRAMTRVFLRRALATATARATGQNRHERYPHTIVA
jgi:carbon-monoxide dehydrogenase medium subunit